MVIDDEGRLLVSRNDMVATLDRVRTAGLREPEDLAGPLAVALSGAARHLVVTRVATGDLRRAEVWLGPTGVVAVADQGAPDLAAPCVAGPPGAAGAVVLSTLALDPRVRGARDGSAVGDVEALCADVLDGRADGVVTLLGERAVDRGDELTARWVVVDRDGWRRADFASDGMRADLAPCSTMTIVGVVTRLVSETQQADGADVPNANDGGSGVREGGAEGAVG